MPEINELKIVFAGTPDFSVPSLRALVASEARVVGVYTQPDRPAGRGRRLSASPVKRVALEHGLPVYQPATLKDPTAVAALAALEADLVVVVAYGLLLPSDVLATPGLGCINVHASLLPRWRGAAPIQRALLAGDSETGITIMGMETGLDTGPMYLKRATPIATDETGASLHDRVSQLGAETLMAALPGIGTGRLQPQPQDASQATYAKKITKDEARIDWRLPAIEIERRIRAFNPWPVAETRLDDISLRLWGGFAVGGETQAAPGAVLTAGRAGIDVATGQGVLRLTRVQPAGKRPMDAADYINARRLDGERFG